MSFKYGCFTGIACALLALLFVHPTLAVDDPAAAREIVLKRSDAVVTVSLVIKMQMSMEGQSMPNEEMKFEVRGTTVDPSGLTVISLSDSSPDEVLSRMGYGEDGGFQISAETTDVKIRLSSGTEIPAKIVLRDKDLDLAFVRPAQKLASPAPFVDLADSCKLDVLDPVVVLGRLGKVASRVPCAAIDHVQAIIPKPRTLYVPGEDAQNSPQGVPIFGMDGKVAGILVARMSPAGSDSSRSYMGDSGENYIAVILPAADVLEIAKQAPEQAAEEPKPASTESAPAAEVKAEAEQ